MNCRRCNGLAVSDDSITIQIGSSSDCHGWRCLNCGMIIDDVIRRNQLASPRPKLARRQDLRRYRAHA
jgi:RNase P subunit RPR2